MLFLKAATKGREGKKKKGKKEGERISKKSNAILLYKNMHCLLTKTTQNTFNKNIFSTK